MLGTVSRATQFWLQFVSRSQRLGLKPPIIGFSCSKYTGLVLAVLRLSVSGLGARMIRSLVVVIRSNTKHGRERGDVSGGRSLPTMMYLFSSVGLDNHDSRTV